MENQYDSMTLVKLKEKAKEKGMKNITSLKKSELIEALKNYDLNNNSNEESNEKGNEEAAPVIAKEDKRRSSHTEMEQLDSGER